MGSFKRMWSRAVLLTLTLGSVPAGCDGARAGAKDSQSPDAGADLQEVIRIDGEAMSLGSVEWVGISSNDRIAVLQPEESNIRFFTTRGAADGSFGKKGRGPGEFERPIRAGWVGDSLWVQDPVLDRVTIVAPDGSLTHTLLLAPKIVKPNAIAADSAGYIVAYPRGMLSPNALLYSGLNRSDESTDLFVADSMGKVTNHVIRLPRDGPASVTVPMPGGVAYLHVPFFARTRDAIAPDARTIAVVTTNFKARTFTVTVVGANGETLFTREIGFEPVTIPKIKMDSAVGVQLERARGVPERLKAKSEMQRLIPTAFPPVAGLMIDNLGRTWVGLRPTSERTQWLILARDGSQVGAVTLPRGVRPLAANKSIVLAIETDENDVESVVGYALELHSK